ncbi:ROK family protein [Geosporobacter ferrireducens]|uniref:Glucokinase n=1 Tax=Geosporobacter ferrireducens TaxID=1424294 RepID=A0A1D8GML0_9FIRM|nr:ROK family glucokinase [Geosporobacter ferrireducens]AOT72166.1 glucokinase [Geosporobacter ferrireducens]MTI56055.1 ROK family glucokinase [Geosporobacter ferrireducens]
MLIGVDLGGTNIKVGIVNQEGQILYQNSRTTNPSRPYPLIIQDIIEQIEGCVSQLNGTVEDIKSIGIGIPGIAELQTGNVIYCTNLSWYDVPMGEMIRTHFNKPVYIENDATVAALAESVSGSTKGLANSVFLTLGTGVGGGIIINHKAYSGSHGAGSEIGHMIVGENFYECNCGRNGCLETFTSATAMIRYAQKRIREGVVDTEILNIAEGNIENITAKVIFDSAQKGDQLATEVVERMIKYLSIGIANIHNMLDPDRITIGGGVSKAGDALLEPLREAVAKLAFCKGVIYGDITLAQLGNDAGIIGAAFLGESL